MSLGSSMQIARMTALVTGGASGLGLATVGRLVDEGAHIIALDLPYVCDDSSTKSNRRGGTGSLKRTSLMTPPQGLTSP
jgi:nucleoside-diphosphate-sugar epimerase